jgi:hypothetical protein
MAGSKHGWRSLTATALFLAGCVGLGDTPSNSVETKQPRPQPANQQAPTPDLRIPNEAAAPAQAEIPLVPVPVPPVNRPAAPPSRPPIPTPIVPPAAPAAPTTPTASMQPDGSQAAPAHTARQLLDQAAARCRTLDSYIVRLTRRESRKGKPGPEEIIAFFFRKEPFSVRFKWLGDTAKGREVIYVKGRFEGKIHTRVADGDAPFMPAGSKMALSPDNPLVRAASRHPITDAGVCHCVQSLIELLDRQERGDRSQGELTVLAPQRRLEYPQPIETLQRILPPKVEPELPNGGRRLMYFDPNWQLPLLVITYDDKGTEVEYYRYDRLIAPANLDDDDFNPDKLWAAPRPAPKR